MRQYCKINMINNILEQIQNKSYRDSHPICPYCKEEIDMTEEMSYSHITYWGDDGPKEDECPHCHKIFFINEIVTRSWEIYEHKQNEE